MFILMVSLYNWPRLYPLKYVQMSISRAIMAKLRALPIGMLVFDFAKFLIISYFG